MLDLRQKALETAQLAFAAEEQKHQQFVEQLETMAQRLAQTLRDFDQLIDDGSLSPLQCATFSDYLARQKRERKQTELARQHQAKIMEERRVELNTAAVRAKAIECLKDKASAQYQQALLAHEQAQLEEIGLQRYLKRAI